MKLKQFAAVLLLSAATFVGGGWMYAQYAHGNPLTSNTTSRNCLKLLTCVTFPIQF